jgi:FdrA protein
VIVPTSAIVRSNLYKDSVALMRIAQVLLAREGVRRATLLMGTPANKDILADAGLRSPAIEHAGPGDVMVIVEADTVATLDEATDECAHLLDGERPAASSQKAGELPLRSLAMAHAASKAAVLAQISVPGPYAAAEAMKALRRGLHVFLFSDNVPVEQERAIKALARAKGLLVMGPDCGTAVVRRVPLGFANVVREGTISLVGASGTGLQEVMCRIDALGHGIRHAIGTGGRDVAAEVGGSTMRDAIDLLATDPGTRVIGIVSKPPSPAVAREVLEQVAAIDKPVVVLFLGADIAAERVAKHVVPVATLHDAAAAAVALREGRSFVASRHDAGYAGLADAEARQLTSGQCIVRGLYSGGTFRTEADLLWRDLGLAYTAIDLGADEFTVGRPHPMIDPSTRIERIGAAARDPSTAALVLDVVLGYGAHDDPAGALAPAIEKAKATCAQDGRHLPVMAFVCGTEADPQRLSVQQAKLTGAGALVVPDSTLAARLAGAIGRLAASRPAGRVGHG